MGVIKSSPHRLIVVMMLFSPLFFTNRRDREYGWSKLSTHHVLWLWTCNALPLPNTISNHSGNAHCSFFYKKNKQKNKTTWQRTWTWVVKTHHVRWSWTYDALPPLPNPSSNLSDDAHCTLGSKPLMATCRLYTEWCSEAKLYREWWKCWSDAGYILSDGNSQSDAYPLPWCLLPYWDVIEPNAVLGTIGTALGLKWFITQIFNRMRI